MSLTNTPPTAELQALDAAHHMHPFTANGALAEKGARIITRAEGVRLTDSDGAELIDGMAGCGASISAMGAPNWQRPPRGKCANCPFTTRFSRPAMCLR